MPTLAKAQRRCLLVGTVRSWACRRGACKGGRAGCNQMRQVEQRFLLGLWAQGTRLTDTVPCGRDARQAPGPQRREEAGDTRGVGGQAWRTFTGGGPGAWGLPVPTVLCGGPALHGTQDTRCTTPTCARHTPVRCTCTSTIHAPHMCVHTRGPPSLFGLCPKQVLRWPWLPPHGAQQTLAPDTRVWE